MTAPIVSAILPLHNGEAWLDDAIQSVLSQSFAQLELVIVDDHSTDQGPSLAKRAARLDDRVRLFASPRRGVAAARNEGIAATRSDYIAFIDQDDLWPEDKLAVQVEAIRLTEADLLIGHIRHFLVEGVEPPRWLRPELLEGTYPGWTPGALLCTRRAFESLGGLDETFTHGGDDVDFFMRAKDAGLLIEVVGELVLLKRIHRDNVSGRMENRKDLFRAVAGSVRRKAAQQRLA